MTTQSARKEAEKVLDNFFRVLVIPFATIGSHDSPSDGEEDLKDKITQAILTARKDALEEAAKYVEQYSPWKEGLTWTSDRLAAAIRALGAE